MSLKQSKKLKEISEQILKISEKLSEPSVEELNERALNEFKAELKNTLIRVLDNMRLGHVPSIWNDEKLWPHGWSDAINEMTKKVYAL